MIKELTYIYYFFEDYTTVELMSGVIAAICSTSLAHVSAKRQNTMLSTMLNNHDRKDLHEALLMEKYQQVDVAKAEISVH